MTADDTSTSSSSPWIFGDRVRVRDDKPAMQCLYPSLGTVTAKHPGNRTQVQFDPDQWPAQGRITIPPVWLDDELLELVKGD